MKATRIQFTIYNETELVQQKAGGAGEVLHVLPHPLTPEALVGT